MNINASIIDQRLIGIVADLRDRVVAEFGPQDEPWMKSLAFVYLCTKELLDLDADTAFDCLTEGAADFGVDAMHVSEEIDGEFGVTLVQGKYRADLGGQSGFPANGIEKLVNAVRHIFDPSSTLGAINDRLRARVEEVRSLIRDGYLPRVRVIACNNGVRWESDAAEVIRLANLGPQVSWEHANHDTLVAIMQRTARVTATLRLTGRAVVEDLAFSRVCIGRIPVTEVAALMQEHGEKLLERNIRRYLGLHGNRVNEGIRHTLTSDAPSDFYLFNNGITLVCDDFSYNALQQADYQVAVSNLQIVNGGQTCMTILRTAGQLEHSGAALPRDASVMVRLYKLPPNRADLALRITQATNSQNPVDLRDLRANDTVQLTLESGIELLGYTYRRRRTEGSTQPRDMTSGTVAEAVLAVWRRQPHRARFFAREHFGKLYDDIFTAQLNAAQAVLAVLLYRVTENRRRRPSPADPPFVRYASCFLAMQMGRRLLRALGVTAPDALTHQNFEAAHALLETNADAWFTEAVGDVDAALEQLYGDRHRDGKISLQQLSATFRRGDLFAYLPAANGR